MARFLVRRWEKGGDRLHPGASFGCTTATLHVRPRLRSAETGLSLMHWTRLNDGWSPSSCAEVERQGHAVLNLAGVCWSSSCPRTILGPRTVPRFWRFAHARQKNQPKDAESFGEGRGVGPQNDPDSSAFGLPRDQFPSLARSFSAPRLRASTSTPSTNASKPISPRLASVPKARTLTLRPSASRGPTTAR